MGYSGERVPRTHGKRRPDGGTNCRIEKDVSER